jgi:hypothetical protein
MHNPYGWIQVFPLKGAVECRSTDFKCAPQCPPALSIPALQVEKKRTPDPPGAKVSWVLAHGKM